MPVRREPDPQEPWVRGLPGAVREHDPMLEQELGTPRDCVRGAVAREPEDGAPRLVERRMHAVTTAVAVPATVRPLRRNERLGEHIQAWIASEPDVDARLQRATLQRRVPAHAPVDSPRLDVGQALPVSHPGKRALGCCESAGMPRFDTEVDQRDEAPERSSPLRVRMRAVVARERVDEVFTHGQRRRDLARATVSERRPRTPRPATGPRAAGGSRRGRCGRRAARRSSRRRCRGRTRACNRA